MRDRGPQARGGGGELIEFTLSRVVLCVCGAVLLVTVAGIMGQFQEHAESGMEDDLVEDIAEMLDVFEGSDLDSMTLDGALILPSSKHVLKVSSNIVLLEKDEIVCTAMTRCGAEFELWYGGTVTITKRCQSPNTSAIWRRVSVNTSISSVLL